MILYTVNFELTQSKGEKTSHASCCSAQPSKYLKPEAIQAVHGNKSL